MKLQEEQPLWIEVRDALLECITAHGPINSGNLTSAIKRVVRRVMEMSKDGTMSGLALETLDILHLNELKAAQHKVSKFIRQNNELKSHCKTIEKNIEKIKKDKDYERENLRSEVAALKNKLAVLESFREKRILRYKIQEHTLHQLTQKIAYNLWVIEGKPEGKADEHWLIAEKLALKLMEWKPDGKNSLSFSDK